MFPELCNVVLKEPQRILLQSARPFVAPGFWLLCSYLMWGRSATRCMLDKCSPLFPLIHSPHSSITTLHARFHVFGILNDHFGISFLVARHYMIL